MNFCALRTLHELMLRLRRIGTAAKKELMRQPRLSACQEVHLYPTGEQWNHSRATSSIFVVHCHQRIFEELHFSAQK